MAQLAKMPVVRPAQIAEAQQPDPNVALLIQSLQSADVEPKQVAVVDGMPQDDVSQYLLDASAPGK